LRKPELHIVSFAIPDPPDYGGIIDVYYKVKYLAEAGVKIYLHCSQYDNRKPSEQLEKWCEKVWYYPRKTGLSGLSLKLPYTVFSRRDDSLLHNLQSTSAPILFDGLMTAYYLHHPALNNRKKIFRPQNVEQDYYRLLAVRTKHPLKKIYYKREATLLKRFENRLQNVDAFFTVAEHDYLFFQKKYPEASHEYIPSFQPYNEVKSKAGYGNYCLYQGNLSVEENEEAALFLVEKVFSQLQIPFIIAGKNPSLKLQAAADSLKNCTLIANPDKAKMDVLIEDAHIHVLPTFQNTGLKLKLLHALFQGRFVLVNNEMLTGTGLESLCETADDAAAFMKTIQHLMSQPFDAANIAKRKEILLNAYNNRTNAECIVTYLQQIFP